MIKKILMFLSAAVFAVGLAGCDAGMDKAGETMDKPSDAMGGGAPAEPAAPAAPAPEAPAEPAPAAP